jgi:hypothetical protein
VSMILRGFVFVVVWAALGGALAVYAQGSPANSPAGQLDSCRQNVIQLTEQARVEQQAHAEQKHARKERSVRFSGPKDSEGSETKYG